MFHLLLQVGTWTCNPPPSVSQSAGITDMWHHSCVEPSHSFWFLGIGYQYASGWPWTYNDLPVSASWMLGSEVCAIILGYSALIRLNSNILREWQTFLWYFDHGLPIYSLGHNLDLRVLFLKFFEVTVNIYTVLRNNRDTLYPLPVLPMVNILQIYNAI